MTPHCTVELQQRCVARLTRLMHLVACGSGLGANRISMHGCIGGQADCPSEKGILKWGVFN